MNLDCMPVGRSWWSWRALVLSIFLLSVGQPLGVVAQTDIYVRGAGRLIPIAVPQLCLQAGDPNVAREIPTKIGRNLDLSGYFEVLDPAAYIETPGKCGGPESVAYTDWTVLRTEGLVKGVVSASGGRLRIQMYLHDVAKKSVAFGKEYEGGMEDVAKIAHKFSNEIMKYYTGEYGPFGTQIAFSTKTGRFKDLAVMDMDGSNIRQLTNERGLALSASWSPDGSRLVYTSYRQRVPDLFLLDVASRRTQQVTSNTSLELGAKFARDGGSLLISTSDGSQSSIQLIGLNGQAQRRLTNSPGGIDVSPHWSPDYSQIIFCSNRGGGPQIYTMGADGSGVKRVSFTTSSYCTSPSWSPKGDKIAFTCRADSGFQLFVANRDGSEAMQLTSFGDNEDPDWSPDGRYLAFGTTFGKGRGFGIGLIRSDGVNMKALTEGRTGDSQPSWGPQLN